MAQTRLRWDHTNAQAALNLSRPRNSQQLKGNREAAWGAGNITGLETREDLVRRWEVSFACKIGMGLGEQKRPGVLKLGSVEFWG